MKTKFLTLFLALIASIGTMSAWDHEGVQIGGLYYNLDDSNVTAQVAQNGAATGNVVIPETVSYGGNIYSVTSIENYAFNALDYSNMELELIGYAVADQQGAFPDGLWNWGNRFPLGKPVKNGDLYIWTAHNVYLQSGEYKVRINDGSYTPLDDAIYVEESIVIDLIVKINATTDTIIIENASTPLTQVIVSERFERVMCINAINTNLISVSIPNSVTNMGNGTFAYCSSLRSVAIGNSIQEIGDYTFISCNDLISVDIPYNVTRIGKRAFNGCGSLISVTIPNGVTSIGDYAFGGCSSLPSVTIGNGVTNIGKNAFAGCSSLTSVTIPNSVTSIGDYAFSGCSSLPSVTIGNGVTNIGERAFEGCISLAYVEMKTVVPPTIPDYNYDYRTIFYQCDNLNAIYIPCGSFEAYRDANCWWYLYSSLIQYMPLPHTISVNETTLGSVEIPQFKCNELIEITANPDRGCYFVSWSDGNADNPRTIELTQDTTMEAIFDYLLTGKCGKDSALTWSLDTTSMALYITDQGALSENYTYGTFIQSLTIGNEVTSIGQSAFSGFTNLKNVILGSSVKVLESGAFNGCSSIETITCYSQRPPTVNGDALYGLDYSTIVYVPADYLETYKMHDTWGLYDVRPLESLEAIETIESKNIKSVNKLFRNGQILILRGDKTFTLTGQEVR